MNLDPLKSQNPGLLSLQPFEYLVRIIAVHFRFLHEWERYTVVNDAEGGNLFIVVRFLVGELGKWLERISVRREVMVPDCMGIQ